MPRAPRWMSNRGSFAVRHHAGAEKALRGYSFNFSLLILSTTLEPLASVVLFLVDETTLLRAAVLNKDEVWSSSLKCSGQGGMTSVPSESRWGTKQGACSDSQVLTSSKFSNSERREAGVDLTVLSCGIWWEMTEETGSVLRCKDDGRQGSKVTFENETICGMMANSHRYLGRA